MDPAKNPMQDQNNNQYGNGNQNVYPNFQQGMNAAQPVGVYGGQPQNYNFNQPQGYGQPVYGQPVYGQGQPQMVQPVFMNNPDMIIVGVNTVTDRPYTRGPQKIFCRTCNTETITRVHFEVGNGTWIAVFIICIVGCWPCCLIPLCIQDCMDCQHHCSICGNYCGAIKFLN